MCQTRQSGEDQEEDLTQEGSPEAGLEEVQTRPQEAEVAASVEVSPGDGTEEAALEVAAWISIWTCALLGPEEVVAEERWQPVEA